MLRHLPNGEGKGTFALHKFIVSGIGYSDGEMTKCLRNTRKQPELRQKTTGGNREQKWSFRKGSQFLH